MLVETLVAELAIEALDVGVLNGLARANEVQLYARWYAQASRVLPVNPGPLSDNVIAGKPRTAHAVRFSRGRSIPGGAGEASF